MLIGTIMTPLEDVIRNPQRFREAPLKVAEVLKQLPPGVSVKARYIFGGGDNVKSIMVFDVQTYEQLIQLTMTLPEYFHVESYPVIDNSSEVVQQAVR